ncbi:MAG: LysM peptidoglycan-binding domain-containing protein [Casimicrobiaceae bacterium]|nr:LysM peptidoglycan-binding domain-containing protein [Casimicrobiaceae bacterium]MDW8311238.1 LysM peptidoglycan-binding domain-containing protein [Burkholderiales bacterium]
MSTLAQPQTATASAPVQIAEGAPDRYTVVRGDTLWGIAGKFLKQPWRWPEVWRLNREQIRNPHLIFPGQVIVLDRHAPEGPRLLIGEASAGERPLVRLSPQVRAEAKEAQPIPSIPPGDIDPFIVKDFVIGAEAFAEAAQIVRAIDERVTLSAFDSFYAIGARAPVGTIFHVYRRGKELRDPEIPPLTWFERMRGDPDRQVVGYEATYLGEAKLVASGDLARFEIVRTRQEILVGDYLLPAPAEEPVRYVPRAPERPIEARIMTLPTGIAEAGRASVVTINRGAKAGLEVGHVLAIFKPAEDFANPRFRESSLNWVPGWPRQPDEQPRTLTIPEERVGLVFVYRTFDHVAYGLVMNSGRAPIKTGYILRNP